MGCLYGPSTEGIYILLERGIQHYLKSRLGFARLDRDGNVGSGLQGAIGRHCLQHVRSRHGEVRRRDSLTARDRD